jgi:hypothetical protein
MKAPLNELAHSGEAVEPLRASIPVALRLAGASGRQVVDTPMLSA